MHAIPLAGLGLACLSTLPSAATQEAVGLESPVVAPVERPTTSPGWFVRLRPGPDHAARLADLGEARRAYATASATERDARHAAFDSVLVDLRAGAGEARAAVRERLADHELLGSTWLVPGLAVGQLDAATRAELLTRDDVLAVEPIGWQLPAIGTAVDANHHDAVGAHGLSVGGQSLTGHGVEVAVLDSGMDLDMAGIGRPHRAFYVDANPLNPAGGGIGGSRVLTEKNFGGFFGGPQTSEDIFGHGTRVASTIAAAKWSNGPDVADSVAFSASLHNYKISDDAMPGGAASTFDMAEAFDEAASHPAIRVANMSYDGDPAPLYFLNLNIDAASNAGVLVVLSAGNNASDLTFAHGAYNSLAVGSSYELLPFPYWTSAIGPLDPFGIAPRRYPDLIANGDQISTATFDAETQHTLATGTSLAAGFVSGAGALLFQADPALTPVEAKALLLEHTWDVTSGNPKAAGLGYLRVKEAVDAALAGDVRGGQLEADGSLELRVTLTAGSPVRYTLAWERGTSGVGVFSTLFDLDLFLVDPAGNVVASSTTDFDVEERVEFTPAVTGTYRIQVLEPGADSTSSPVSWALAGPGLGGCAGVDVDQVAPIVAPAAVLPGTLNPITLGGCGLDQVTAVSLGGSPVPFLASSSEELVLDVAGVPAFGATPLDLTHPGGVVSTTVELGPAGPLIFGPQVLPMAGPSTLTVASQPGDVHALLAAPDQLPSVVPGVLALDIGSTFTTVFQVTSLAIPPGQAFQTWSVQPPFGLPFGQSFFLQSVVFGPSSPGLPLTVSNVKEVTIVP